MSELYDCPQKLIAKATSFKSLQCSISCCEGMPKDHFAYQNACVDCGHYVVNRHTTDVVEDAAFLQRKGNLVEMAKNA